MEKFVEKVVNTVSNGWTRVVLGIFVCLLAIFGALSNAPVNDGFIYVSKFINWCISFLVGGIWAYAIYFVIFLLGLRLIFSSKKLAKVNFNLTIAGTVLIILGCLILVANSLVDENLGYLSFSNFNGYFVHIYEGFPNVNNYQNGGVIGLVLVALINSGMTNIGSNVIGSVLLVLGLFLAFGKPFIKGTKIIIDYKNQVFRKDVKENNPNYDVAKNVSYNFQNVNNIQPEAKVEESIAENSSVKIKETEIKPEVNPIVSNMLNEPSRTVVKKEEPIKATTMPNKEVSSIQTDGLVKAHFSFKNEEVISEEKNVETLDKEEEISVAPVVEETNKSVSEPVNNVPIQHETIDYGNKVTQETLSQVASQNTIRQNVATKVVEEKPITKEENVQDSIVNQQPTIVEKPISEPVQKPVNTQTNKMSQKEIDELASKKPEFAEPEETTYSNKVEIKKDKQYVGEYVYPPVELLENRDASETMDENVKVCEARKEMINQIFQDLNIGASIVGYTIGPSVTRFDLQTEKSVSISGISKYMDDISVRLSGVDCRFVPIVQGKPTSGIEIANAKVSLVNFKDCVEHLPKGDKYGLYVPFGQDISGNYVSADLKEFPHLLVCGTTGSGKSIFMHSVIMSLIMRNAVDDLKIVMIDPKRVEFGKYKEMPHLLCPPINDSHKAYIALQKLCAEMDRRYEVFENCGVSNIKQYNQEALENGKDKMPYIVLICDEFADLMDTNRKCSEPVVRLGQKARASGIHMIIATQRPSTNVITGTIKANLPVRVALSCSSYTDSMTILGEGGAEKLLGNGDMLVSCPLISKQGFVRVQGSFVDNKEIRKTVEFLKEHYPVKYDPEFLDLEEKTKSTASLEDIAAQKEDGFNSVYDNIKKWVMTQEYTSISKIQRTFSLGFPRAGKMFNRLEEEGIIERDNAGVNNSKGRRVLIHAPTEPFVQSSNPGSIEQTTMDYSKKEY